MNIFLEDDFNEDNLNYTFEVTTDLEDPEYILLEEELFKVKQLLKKKIKKINPRTNRMKKFKKQTFLATNIPMVDRTFKNLPRYANGKPKVHFVDWLKIVKIKSYPAYGWAKELKEKTCFGWSHRAIAGFKVGDKVKKDTIGNHSKKEYTLKTEKEVETMAKAFAKGVN